MPSLTNINLPAVQRQRVEDAALGLQLARARQLKEADPDRLLLGAIPDLQDHVHRLCREAREIISVLQRSQTVEQYLPSHRLNQRLVGDGVGMLSLFETRSLSRPMLELLASAEDMPYYCCYGPIQVKILDRTWVVIDGPIRDELPTILLTNDRELRSNALRYVRAVQDNAVPARDFLAQQDMADGENQGSGVLTERQRNIAALLDAGATDEQVGQALGLSVRTVRYEVAHILGALHARNRFGAGRRYGELTG
jgi:DNA-binding CsgD family transcriptional regulator